MSNVLFNEGKARLSVAVRPAKEFSFRGLARLA